MSATLRLVLALSTALVLELGAQTWPDPPRPMAAPDTAGMRVVISLQDRRLWVLRDGDTIYTASVAVGSGRTLRRGNRTWTFSTPRGVSTVVKREVQPVWIAPDWHYVEIARQQKLDLRNLEFGKPEVLRDGRLLTLRDGRVGVVGADSVFDALPLDEEIVFGGTLYVPPLGSRNREVEGVLGPYRLLLSNGIGLHGTPYKDSIGDAATHGCIRMHDEDITWLYGHIPENTTVVIF